MIAAVDCAPTQSPTYEPGGKQQCTSLVGVPILFLNKLPNTSKETNTMLKSKKKLSALLMATMTLMLAGVAGLAQRHFMLANAARPEVNVQLAGAVERDSKLMPLEK